MKWTEDYLDRLCKEREPESHHIDFKSGDEFNHKYDDKKRRNDLKVELTRDVSAFANADGGVIVYGIKTEKDEAGVDVADHIKPITVYGIDDNWFSGVIRRGCYPPPKFDVKPIPLTEGVAFAVEIEKANEPIQADDYCFWQRVATGKDKLRAFQIDDIRRRQTSPSLDLEIQIRGANGDGQALVPFPEQDGQSILAPIEMNVVNKSSTPAINAQVRLLLTTGPTLSIPTVNGSAVVEKKKGPRDYLKDALIGFGARTQDLEVNEWVRTWGHSDFPIFKEMPQPLSPNGVYLQFRDRSHLEDTLCYYEIYAPGMDAVRGGYRFKMLRRTPSWQAMELERLSFPEEVTPWIRHPMP